MDFWEAQRRARSKTKLYLTVFIALTLIVAVLIEWILREAAPQAYHPPLPLLGVAFLIITFGVALFQYLMFRRYGGSYVAESVGGRLVEQTTTDFKQQQLLNIVKEISLAASLPTPMVYIVDAKQINAFAAGLTPDKAAVAITQGALDTLNREELQGVIAHEFGHISNGDMKISLRLAAMVMGFFFVLYIGIRLLQVASFRGGGNRKGGNPVVLAALAFLGAGALTWLFGSILKASVSREREYLADACAVQYTRNPGGISGALRKIAQEQVKDMPKSGMAYSHLYFDNHLGLDALFATHPSLEKRIAAIEGKEYLPDEWQ